MSEDRDRRREESGGDDPPPMIVLGEDRPDVEDTTAEELRRQKQELVRARRRLEEEAERREREAAEKLEQERREAERELARRQRAIDDAERELRRAEQRLHRRADERGQQAPTVSRTVTRALHGRRGATRNQLLAAAERRSSAPVPRLPRAVVLALASAGLVVGGAVTSIDPPAIEDVHRFSSTDEGHAAWIRAGLALDDEVTRYLAGEDVTPAAGTLRSAELAEQGARLSDTQSSLPSFVGAMGPLLAEPGSDPARVLGAWSDARESSRFTVGSYEVKQDLEPLDNDRAFPTWMLLAGLVTTGTLGCGLLRGGTRVGAGLAALALVPMGMLLVDGDRHLEVEPGIEAHGDALDEVDDAQRQLGDDLQALFGLRTLGTYEREDYWEGPGSWLRVTGQEPTGVRLTYAQARENVDDIDIRSASTQLAADFGLGLVEAGTLVVEHELTAVEDARAAILAQTEADVRQPRYTLLVVGAAALPLLALVPAVIRRRKVTS